MAELFLKRAEKEDCDFWLRLANDPVTRQNSFNTETIPYETHVAWFTKRLTDPDTLLYTMYEGTEKVGDVRLDILHDDPENSAHAEGFAEISYTIAPEKRGMGFGTKIISLIVSKAKEDCPEVTKLVALVKADNPASIRVFLKNEFTCVSKGGAPVVRLERSI